MNSYVFVNLEIPYSHLGLDVFDYFESMYYQYQKKMYRSFIFLFFSRILGIRYDPIVKIVSISRNFFSIDLMFLLSLVSSLIILPSCSSIDEKSPKLIYLILCFL